MIELKAGTLGLELITKPYAQEAALRIIYFLEGIANLDRGDAKTQLIEIQIQVINNKLFGGEDAAFNIDRASFDARGINFEDYLRGVLLNLIK